MDDNNWKRCRYLGRGIGVYLCMINRIKSYM